MGGETKNHTYDSANNTTEKKIHQTAEERTADGNRQKMRYIKTKKLKRQKQESTPPEHPPGNSLAGETTDQKTAEYICAIKNKYTQKLRELIQDKARPPGLYSMKGQEIRRITDVVLIIDTKSKHMRGTEQKQRTTRAQTSHTSGMTKEACGITGE